MDREPGVSDPLRAGADVGRLSQPPRATSETPPSANSALLERWFQSMRPPAPSSPEHAAPPTPEPPDRAARRRMGWKVIQISVASGLVIVLAATIIRVRAGHMATGPAPAGPVVQSTAAVVPNAVAPAPAPPSPPVVVAAAQAPAALASTTGEILLPRSANNHRVFVDGRVVATAGSNRLRAACGHHTVRIGSSAKALPLDVPCGGSIALAR